MNRIYTREIRWTKMDEEKTNDPLTSSPLEEEDNEELSDDEDGSTSSSEVAEWNNNTAEQQKTSRTASKTEHKPTKPTMVKLEDQMNNENLEMLQKIFEEADEDGGGGLDMDEFRMAMIKTMAGKGEVPDDNQLAIIFMKVDANCDGTVDWEEFCSYMLLETQLKDVMSSEDREMEFPIPAKEIPSSHRDTITRITYLPKLSHGTDDPTDSNGGRYVSVSKEGTLHFWNMDLHPQKTLSLGHEGKASKNVWITDCVVLPNVKKLALSTADSEIAFYDCAATSFDKQYVICSLDYCVLTMDYWCSSTKSNVGILLCGDAGGSVICLKLKFNAMTVSFRRFSLWEIQQGKHSNITLFQFNNLHEDWIRKVRYYPSLHCFISCATASNTSMYLGDVERKTTSSVFRIRKGITSFDYCKEWNVIVTGGLDHYVRLWNPYVTAKATSVLKGHSSAVTHILVNSDKGEIISAAQDKFIKIWDMRDLCCVQTIPARSLLPGPHVISSLYYNSYSHCIFVGTNQLSVIEGKKEEPSEEHTITSHSKPLCAAIYNDLFDQLKTVTKEVLNGMGVVSACHDSVVCVWSLETGEKIIQFSNAHGNSEITAMRFDPSKRRLITGGRDGTVRIWNFNNGCCLSELQAVDKEEKIITVGWNRNVTIYKDCRNEDPAEEEDPRVWSHFHDDDILSAAMYPTGLVATSSYDGLVKVWNIESGSVNCRLHVCDYGLERTQSVIPSEVKRLVTHCNTVSETENRLKEEMSRKRSIYSDKKNRRCTSMQSVGRLKNCSVQKDRLENSQTRKSHLPDLSPLKSNESYHDSSVDKVLFLEKRENSLATATLITSGSNGSVRAWSVCGGGLLGYFTAAQGNHDSVLSMTTNGDNSILITGDTAGFIKLWDISCYCISGGDQKPAAPQQRKLSLGNRRYSQKSSKAGGINTKPPPLVISFRAHLQPIVSLDFVDNRQLVITASKDASVRLWTQTGRYIGLFGQRVLWDIELATEGLRRLPPDIQRIASAETLRSFLSSPRPKWRLARHVMHITAISRRGTQSTLQSSAHNTDWENEWGPSINQSLKNILGKFYKPKIRHKPLPPLPKLKFNQDQMIVYSCLNFKDLQAVEEPKTPALLCSHNTRKNSSSGLLPRIAKTRGHRSNSDSKHTTYFSAPGKQARASTFRKPPEILRSSFKK